MEIISHAEFKQLFDGTNKILEKDSFGIKIVETSNHKIIKLFRLKRYFSSALFHPYAVRFQKNAEQLKDLDIPSVTVEKLAYCREENRHIAIYPKLQGVPLRDALRTACDPSLLVQLAGFIATLHSKGIYFRSLHLGNIILMKNAKFALIDLADMRILKKSLNPKLRIRNFRHLLRYKQDCSFIETFGIEDFVSEYLKSTRMNQKWVDQFRSNWNRHDLPLLTRISSITKYCRSDP